MQYITLKDLKIRIQEQHIADMLDEELNMLNDIEASAIEVVNSNVQHRYNMKQEYNKKDVDRNIMLVDIIIDIMLYNIYSRVSRDGINQLRIDRYNVALETLTKINKGIISPSLMMKEDSDMTTFIPTIIGGKSRTYRYDW